MAVVKRHKKPLIIFVVLVVLVVGYLLLSPLWRSKTLNEALPGVSDRLTTMDAATRADFERQTDAMRSDIKQMDDEMSAPSAEILKRATFHPRAHEVSGEALLVGVDGSKILRFENFETINGPDLRIYLSKGLNAHDYIDLGAIRATKGNINYVLPAGTDTDQYRYVLVWCRAFSVLFSYAEL